MAEVPCAFVILWKGYEVSDEDLKQQVLSRIAKNEVPVTIPFGNKITLNKGRKPNKYKIQELF